MGNSYNMETQDIDLQDVEAIELSHRL